MGHCAEAREAIFGHKIADMNTLWNAFGIDEYKEYKRPKTESEQKMSVDDFKDEVEQRMPEFWAQFLTVYAEKYEELNDSDVAAFIGTYSGDRGDTMWYEYVVIFGVEIDIEKMKITDGRCTLYFALPKDFDSIVHDFLAFNLKYGKQYVEACLDGEKFSEYAIVPEEEAKELVKKSEICLPKERSWDRQHVTIPGNDIFLPFFVFSLLFAAYLAAAPENHQLRHDFLSLFGESEQVAAARFWSKVNERPDAEDQMIFFKNLFVSLYPSIFFDLKWTDFGGEVEILQSSSLAGHVEAQKRVKECLLGGSLLTVQELKKRFRVEDGFEEVVASVLGKYALMREILSLHFKGCTVTVLQKENLIYRLEKLVHPRSLAAIYKLLAGGTTFESINALGMKGYEIDENDRLAREILGDDLYIIPKRFAALVSHEV